MSGDPWNRAVGDYLTAMTAANRAPRTRRLHRHYLAQLSRVHSSPWTVTVADLRTVMATPTWGPDARKSARSVYRGFYSWAVGSGLIQSSPAEQLEAIRVPVASPRPTPELIVRRLLQSVDERVRFMGLLAAHLGMRCAEIAVVHEQDFDGRRLLVHGKGGKTRTAFVIDVDLVELLASVRGWAFPGPHGPMTAGHVSRLLSRALPDGWTAHTLRHRAATVAHEATGDIFAVSKMLGHSQVATTQRYVAVSDRAIMAAYAAAAA